MQIRCLLHTELPLKKNECLLSLRSGLISLIGIQFYSFFIISNLRVNYMCLQIIQSTELSHYFNHTIRKFI